MFNYFTSERHKDIQQAKQINRNAEEKVKQLKKCTSQSIVEKDKILMRKYVDRTTHSYERMLDASHDMKEYKNYRHQFRDFNKSLNVGPPSFYFHPRDDKDRVKEALKQNKTLDKIPFFGKQNPAFHQFRSNKSDGNMKFTSFDSKSRVIQAVKNMSTNQIPNSWDIDLKGYLSFCKTKVKLNSIERNMQSSILPALNIKHHPKTLSSIHNRLQVGATKNVHIDNKKNHIEDSDDEIRRAKENIRNRQSTHTESKKDGENNT